ncbi:UDP-glucose 4-epimerase GalE [Candidatus Pseudothioglobus singularis]|nr:UDP-glucose 4-epimerase GalE [Candidatus Pseudothioglobus singularis]
MKKSLFIVGGAGYIGSHMVKYAYEAGYEVVTLDNLSTGHRDAVKYGVFEFCELSDSKKLNILFQKYCPAAVVHFGGVSIVNESIVNPLKYYINNVSGTLNLLDSMVKNNCLKLIFSSSASVYGNPEYSPIDESHPKKPINPYGKSKLIIEQMLEDFDTAYDLNYLTFRYFNAAGHDFEGELSERHDPETHLLPLIVKAALGENESVEIFGTDYNTRDGSCVRDYIHVKDLCEAHLKGLDLLFNSNTKPNSNFFNIGNSRGFSVKEVISEVKKVVGSEFKVINKSRREGDPEELVASNIKAFEVLKFSPKITKIKDIIKTLL